MVPQILYEDDDELLVIDKPAGMVVNAAESVKTESIQEWIARNFQFPISNDQLRRNGIVHRIDKETSGVLLVAKTPEAFENLQKQFAKRGVEKTYIALVHGKVMPATGVIRAPVGRLPWNRMRFGVLAGGREAETRYRVIKHWKRKSHISPQHPVSYLQPHTPFTLLELHPKTGRTHQLRVHLKSIGHPIVADEFYAGRKTARADRKWCPRVFLHAESLSFTHPKTGEKLTIKSKLPEDLKTALGNLDTIA